MPLKLTGTLTALSLALVGAPPAPPAPVQTGEGCAHEIVVLGAGQDAGAPQIGNSQDDGPQLLASSIALIDRAQGKRYLFDAAPQITHQLRKLDSVSPPAAEAGASAGEQMGMLRQVGLDAIFLTHAHIGHYLGLAYLGTEAAGASGVPVYAMPRMAAFLRSNGPWNQLVEQGTIALRPLEAGVDTALAGEVSVRPILVPHRDEYSETVGFVIATPAKRALYLPDLDSWDQFAELTGSSLEQLIASVDVAFVDATFWDDNELEGRDMSAVPHPRVARVMERLQPLPASERAKLHFIHYNHTNPIRDPGSPEAGEVARRGFAIARRGMRVCLSDTS